MPKIRVKVINRDKDTFEHVVTESESLLPTHIAEAVEKKIGTKNYSIHGDVEYKR